MSNVDDWELHWDRYASSAARNPAQRMRHALIVRRLRGLAADQVGARILDLGSGQGDLLARLSEVLPRAELAGFEMSRTGVEISRRKAPTARLAVVDVFAPPPEAAAFHGWATHGACSEVLEHVDDPAAFLRAASVYFAPGGRLVVTVPGGPMSAFDRVIGHRRHFTRESLAEVLRAAGFSAERTWRAGFPFFNLYRLLVILRGRRLAADVEAGGEGAASRLAAAVMTVFRGLFRFNAADFPGGWQIVAVGRKS